MLLSRAEQSGAAKIQVAPADPRLDRRITRLHRGAAGRRESGTTAGTAHDRCHGAHCRGFPVATSLLVFVIDRCSYFVAAPFEPTATVPGMGDPFFWPSAGAWLLCLFPLSLCCRKANQYASSTESVLRQYKDKLLRDLKQMDRYERMVNVMARNERTTRSVAKLAGKVLSGTKKPTVAEIKTLAASALTQTADKAKAPRAHFDRGTSRK